MDRVRIWTRSVRLDNYSDMARLRHMGGGASFQSESVQRSEDPALHWRVSEEESSCKGDVAWVGFSTI